MSTIAGPKIQVPNPLTQMYDENGVMHQQWQVFFHGVQGVTLAHSRSGPTASRPTDALDWRYIGLPYFDTTLGITVYLKSVTPDVWVNGAGAIV